MPRRTDISSILVIGAGPSVIGQACEFDYSGMQALRRPRVDQFNSGVEEMGGVARGDYGSVRKRDRRDIAIRRIHRPADRFEAGAKSTVGISRCGVERQRAIGVAMNLCLQPRFQARALT